MVHALLAAYIKNGQVPGPETFSKDLSFLFWTGKKVVDELRPELEGELLVETALSQGPITGHVDLACIGEDKLVVVDFKSGRSVEDHTIQLKIYAWLIGSQRAAPPKNVFLVLAPLRDQSYDVVQVAWEECVRVAEDVMDNIRRAEGGKQSDMGLYTTGPHCAGCSAKMQCPALAAPLRAIQATIPENITFAGMTDTQLADVKWQMDAMKRILDSVEEAFKMRARVAPIDLGDGRVYGEVEEQSRKMHPVGTVRWLQEKGVPLEKAIGLLDVPVTAVKDFVAEQARKNGQVIKHALTKMEEDLKKRGAMTVTTNKVLRTKKK